MNFWNLENITLRLGEESMDWHMEYTFFEA